MDEAATRRQKIEASLREALSRGELSPAYQPLVEIETGRVVGYEALMRWNTSNHGTIPPSEFIPIAEETGLIVQLGEWVIRTAIDAAARWPDHLGVSINLSPAQMHSPTLISTVVNALASTQIDPGRVEFEITETVLMHDSETNFAVLHKLRDIGVAISLDDFGTGYSSLNYLRSFPFNKIKIDRCFVNGVDSSEECRAIVESVIRLAQSLGMKTTAEGVERPEQLAFLADKQGTIAQGYLFSRAVPSDQLTDLRTEQSPIPGSRVLEFSQDKHESTQSQRSLQQGRRLDHQALRGTNG